MTREGALVLMIGIAVVLLGLMAWAWWRRSRRDATPLTAAVLPAAAEVRARFDGMYVATTRQGEPLQRLAAPGLGFRSKAVIVVADAGVALQMPGQPDTVLAADRIVAVAQATLAIDRVVEKDGLVRVTWRTDPGAIVDTYLRARDASAAILADSIRQLIPTPPTGPTA
jgi:hypothetical protein